MVVMRAAADTEKRRWERETLEPALSKGGERSSTFTTVSGRPIQRLYTADDLSDIRHQLASWLQSAAVPDEQVADIVLSVNEACANSIEHGYRARKPGNVRIYGENDGARVHLKVTDGGSWKTASIDPGVRGRGLLLIRAVSDWLEMDCTPSGTTVDMSFNLPA